MSEFLKRFADNLNKNVPGFIGVAIAEVKTGIVIFSNSANEDFDAELAITFYLEIVRAKINAIYILGLKNQKIDTIIINLTSQIHLVDLSDNGEYFIYLALADNKTDSLTKVKSLITQYKEEIKLIQEELKIVQEDLNKNEDTKARLLREEREQIEKELKIVQEDLRREFEN